MIDFVLHLDVHLRELLAVYGTWTYGILFAIIFSETGLVVTPFLPGDSLLFAAGALAATQSFDVHTLFFLLTTAAIVGNMTNYSLGHYFGPRTAERHRSKFINPEYLARAHQFFERHGGKTIILARFLPILRTFVPFVAGMSSMSYGKFTVYNIIAGACWVGSFIYGGFYFGNLPSVRSHFSLVIIAIIIISMMPAVVTYLRHRNSRRVTPSA